MRLAHQQMELGAVAADLDQSRHDPLLQFRLFRLPGGDSQHIQKIQVVPFGFLERFESARRLGIIFGEEITETQQVPSLDRTGIVFYGRHECWDSFWELSLAIVSQSNI